MFMSFLICGEFMSRSVSLFVPDGVEEESLDDELDLLFRILPTTPPTIAPTTINRPRMPMIHVVLLLPEVCLVSHGLFSTATSSIPGPDDPGTGPY